MTRREAPPESTYPPFERITHGAVGIKPPWLPSGGGVSLELPPITDNLLVWLEADTGVTTDAHGVTTWASPGGYPSAVQATDAAKPAFSASIAENSMPAISFTGAQQHLLTVPSIEMGSDFCIIVRAVTTNGVAAGMLCEYGPDAYNTTGVWMYEANPNLRVRSVASGHVNYNWLVGVSAVENSIRRFQRVSGGYEGYLDSTLQTTSPTSAVMNERASGTFNLGNRNNRTVGLTVDIQVVMVYSPAPSLAEAVEIEEWIANKWGYGKWAA